MYVLMAYINKTLIFIRTLIYKLFLEIFYWKNNKTINVVNNFLYIFLKVVSKLSYYGLLTIVLKITTYPWYGNRV